MPRQSIFFLTLLWFGLVVGAQAQEAPDGSQADESDISSGKPELPSGEPNLSVEEEQELMEALQADSQEGVTLPAPSTSLPVASGKAAGSQSMNPDISFILDVAGAYFTEEEPNQMGAHDPNGTGFTFQQLEMSLSSKVDPYFLFTANVVFSLQGVELEEAYATTLALDGGLQARVGQFLFPFGRANPTHPHTWKFVDQLLSVGKFLGPESGRGLGVELSWLLPLPWYSKVITAVHQPAGECCSASYAGDVNAPVTGPEDMLYTTRWEHFLELSPSLGALAGSSVIVGENKRGLGNLTTLTGGDFMLRYRPIDSPERRSFTLLVEWIERQQQVAGDVLRDHGGYVDVLADLNTEWSTGYRWQLVTGIDSDLQHPEWVSERQRHSGQITWYPSHFSRIRLQGNYDRSEWLPEPVYSLMMSFEVVVGAHGAHSY